MVDSRNPLLLERSAKTLLPGEVAVSAQCLATLLGSCISVCLIDSRLHLIGMNHFLLLSRRTSDSVEANLAGMAAMDSLVNAMMKAGSIKADLRAKVFGGAHLLDTTMTPGERNIQFALEWLSQEGIPLVAMDVGGNTARKIVADPETGKVHCRHVKQSAKPGKVVTRLEAEYAGKLEGELATRVVEYF